MTLEIVFVSFPKQVVQMCEMQIITGNSRPSGDGEALGYHVDNHPVQTIINTKWFAIWPTWCVFPARDLVLVNRVRRRGRSWKWVSSRPRDCGKRPLKQQSRTNGANGLLVDSTVPLFDDGSSRRASDNKRITASVDGASLMYWRTSAAALPSSLSFSNAA